MIHTILMLALGTFAPARHAVKVETCAWPHRCVEQVQPVTQVVHTCVWPHTCAETAQNVLPITGPCPAGRVCLGA